MGRTAAIITTIAALCLGGSGDSLIPGANASTADGLGPGPRAAQEGKTRRRHPRKRRAAGHSSAKAKGAAPASQPAHMAPQLEDIPPVKPPKTTPPKADKRNPVQ